MKKTIVGRIEFKDIGTGEWYLKASDGVTYRLYLMSAEPDLLNEIMFAHQIETDIKLEVSSPSGDVMSAGGGSESPLLVHSVHK